MIKRILYCIFLIFLLVDIGYSFMQHLSQPLDGDMAGGIVPANDVKPILSSPFGIEVLSKNRIYSNPNRFFSHWMFYKFFNSTPLFLQRIVEPIDSIYLACAISKIIIQIVLILLLAAAISGTWNLFKLDFMFAAILVTPFFQTNGYRSYMGIIDPSTTYTFFYALPCAFLLLYFSPFIRQYYHSKKISSLLFLKILLIPLAIIVCLSGPLNPGIVLIVSILILFEKVKSNYVQSIQFSMYKRIQNAIKMIPKGYWFYLFPISIFSIYSLYISRYNSINIANHISLSKLYLSLPEGIYYQFTQKLGFPILFFILILNSIIIGKFKSVEGKKILALFKWIGFFALIYILLLPLGGYRNYRPNVLRYDTIMPITLSLIFVFGITTLFLFKNMAIKQKVWYTPLIVGILLVFTNSDEAQFDQNKCERNALKEISESTENIIQLQNDCYVLSWGKILKPEDSELNAQLLTIWNVTNEKKLYYNK